MTGEAAFTEFLQAHRDLEALKARWAEEMPTCSLNVHLVGLPLAQAISAVAHRVERLREQLPPPPGNDDPSGGTPVMMKEAV